MTRERTVRSKLFLALAVSASALFSTALRPLHCQDYPNEIRYRFEEGSGGDVIDAVSGLSHGTLEGDADFSTQTAGLSSGIENTFSVEISAGYAHIRQVPFVFNRNGARGDASLEWLMNIPAQDDGSIFWSNGDSNFNANRFNLVVTSRSLGADFLVGASSPPSDAIATSPLAPPANTWMAVAVVRKDLGGGSFEWRTYIDGVPSPDHASTTSSPLPVAPTWIIGGRFWGEPSLVGFIDEVRIVDRALREDEMVTPLPKQCPAEGETEFADTSCERIDIRPLPNGVRPLAGWFTVTATAADATDGPLVLFVLRAESTTGERFQVGRRREGRAKFFLCEGTWTITVTVDDDVVCDDEAPEAVCTETFEVGPIEGVGPFLRGDCDGNGRIGGGLTKVIILLNFLFRGSRDPPCLAACDAEANGVLNIADPIRILQAFFLGVGQPDAPFPDCTTSDKETDVELGCDQPLTEVCRR